MNKIVILVLIFILGFFVFKIIDKEKINNDMEKEECNNMKIKLEINNYELTATLVDNSSTQALIEKLKESDITINMNDYGNMEKVGQLDFSLPRNDQNITTESGDLILYQGNHFVIYYDTNNWILTKLGKIDNIDKQQLRNILGSGSVVVTLSLDE
ncbi:MAG TPA: hypothetical protein IAC20_04505 [Candidatus Faecisoma merdavium]|nr:hypothetical protein [Candidatus Faecisoma merdavium]